KTMADNASLGAAKSAKNDEFYTQYNDIEAEMNAYYEYDNDVFRDKTIFLPCDDHECSEFTKFFAVNFERFGLKKLISTSYAKGAANSHLTPLELASPHYNKNKHLTRGKLFTLTHDVNGSGNIDTDDIEFIGYLEGDGDFRSEEVCKLRNEADVIITNPPFSLFREFLGWIIEGQKQFAIIGNQNAITYKEVFPLLKENKAWLGYSIHSGDRKFNVPDDYPLEAATCGVDPDGRKYIRVKGVRWFTNIDHGQRHEPLKLVPMAENLTFNKKLKKKFETEYDRVEYPRYDNYDAIEVPFTESIPSDYDGVMGVPITFLDKYCPDQFEILGATESEGKGFSNGLWDSKSGVAQPVVNGKRVYKRLFIKSKA
ncbi:MAG: adenine-specific methyltransferase EcoRI family protein, partial [Thermoguttaceae bacterium]|nr:adenine-specific methyltransferase EcoRI family protein [Thermoguttaceae bacterium]